MGLKKLESDTIYRAGTCSWIFLVAVNHGSVCITIGVSSSHELNKHITSVAKQQVSYQQIKLHFDAQKIAKNE